MKKINIIQFQSRLKLDRETIRALTTVDLQGIGGAQKNRREEAGGDSQALITCLTKDSYRVC